MKLTRLFASCAASWTPASIPSSAPPTPWSALRTGLAALAFALASGLGSDHALADKESAQKQIERARTFLSEKSYAQAVAAFESAYAAYPSPQFLYNIAQIQRKNLDDCQAALKAYRRFLAAAPFESRALQEAETIARKHEGLLAARCPPAPEPKRRTAVDEAAGGPSVADAAPDPRRGALSDPPGRIEGSYDFTSQELPAVFRLDGGGNQYTLGDIDVPLTASLRGSLGVPLGIEGLPLRGLVSVSLSPMRYRGSEEGVAYFVPLMVGLEVASASEGLAITGSLQVGALGILGLADGNPLTMDGRSKSASFGSAASVRAGMDLPLDSSWSLVGALEMSTASSHEGFAADIESILSYGASAGISRTL